MIFSFSELDLGCNLLQTIDLTPLSKCSRLRNLSLSIDPLLSGTSRAMHKGTATFSDKVGGAVVTSPLPFLGNRLKSIDLSPLNSCRHLETLHISHNQLQSIDLRPLSSCTHLRKLFLSHNAIQSIDLTPLSSCTELEELNLENNKFKSVDITPLSSCYNLQTYL